MQSKKCTCTYENENNDFFSLPQLDPVKLQSISVNCDQLGYLQRILQIVFISNGISILIPGLLLTCMYYVCYYCCCGVAASNNGGSEAISAFPFQWLSLRRKKKYLPLFIFYLSLEQRGFGKADLCFLYHR